jgi:hypothetical protein
MASSTSYNTAGNKEQILDIITVLEPESTPLVSMMKKGNATSTFVEWQADKLSTPDFSGVNEGEDVSSFKNQAEDRARLGNYVQKFRDTFQVSDIQQLVDTAGVASEFANAESKAVRNVKRSIEAAFCSAQDRQAEAGSGTPYKTRGLLKAESATELEDQGGGRRGFVDVICGLACYSPKAHGFFN